MTEHSLGVLQQWLTSVVTAPGDLPAKLQTARELHGVALGEAVAERRGLSAEERVGIYARGYVLRLLECMRTDFPALRSFTGDAVFDAFARAYIISRPPASRSLSDLGAGFPQFLEETKPNAVSGELRALLDLPPDLARLERARAEVHRAPGTERDGSWVEAFSPLAVFEETIQAAPCLRLLELRFPLVAFLKASDRGERPAAPAPLPSHVAVGRSNYRIHIEELAPWQHAFLQACERPVPVYAAARSAALASGREIGKVLAEAALWLMAAADLGFVRLCSPCAT
ncbi:MAG TPA: DNA-binding domain-containing protein [Thermoanaerobaculia bacterium]